MLGRIPVCVKAGEGTGIPRTTLARQIRCVGPPNPQCIGPAKRTMKCKVHRLLLQRVFQITYLRLRHGIIQVNLASARLARKLR